jgi:GH25 family lysozyme M1 (1,4-beta-N-acetylmuramidase)
VLKIIKAISRAFVPKLSTVYSIDITKIKFVIAILSSSVRSTMKLSQTTLLPLLAIAGQAAASVEGFDVSHWQTSVDFKAAKAGGLEFVMIKATESTTYKDPSFSSFYDGATEAGLIRGGYHFAQPGDSSGAAQAKYFFENGGGWTADGITLPGMLDLEADCSDISASTMVSWIQDFVDTYHSLSSRYPILYFSRSWWEECTGNSQAFYKTCPLDLASWNSEVGEIPGGWPYQTFWQYADTNKYGGDSDRFNGAQANLVKLATG